VFTEILFLKCLSKAIQAERGPMGRMIVKIADREGNVKFSTEFLTGLLTL
jgi:hypothetical protein